MLVVSRARKNDAIKEPATLESMSQLQKFMGAQQEWRSLVHRPTSFLQLIACARGQPAYQELGATAQENGELMYMFVSGRTRATSLAFRPSVKYARRLQFPRSQGETIRTPLLDEGVRRATPVQTASICFPGTNRVSQRSTRSSSLARLKASPWRCSFCDLLRNRVSLHVAGSSSCPSCAREYLDLQLHAWKESYEHQHAARGSPGIASAWTTRSTSSTASGRSLHHHDDVARAIVTSCAPPARVFWSPR